MPTYEYACRACRHEFELFQQITAAVKRKCPECGALKLERLIGPGAGVIFKGSGFYQTDYRSDSYKKAAASEKSGGKESKSEPGGKEPKSESGGKEPKSQSGGKEPRSTAAKKDGAKPKKARK